VGTTSLLALGAGMLGAVNPCGFALLPAYLSVLVAGDRTAPDVPGGSAAAVIRAMRCTVALTAGYVAVFGAFGALLAPAAGRLRPVLPWPTIVLGLLLLALGATLAAGTRIWMPAFAVRAPRLTGSTASMVLFGMAYAVVSLGCAVGPFLAVVVGGLRAGSPAQALAHFVAYAAGMGLVVGVTALAVAVARVSVVARLRRVSAAVPRIGGVVLAATGAYVAYYGWYELRVQRTGDPADPVVEAAATAQGWLSGAVDGLGAGVIAAVFSVVLAGAAVLAWRSRRAG
jgi:cytochrome c-type biogenesis protein